ncbi:photosynthetic reaction center subunit H [Maribius pontilimi]|uniref:Photosynthetic reaction center subunit H n=1 Tax=Palleronia pontilimi TaxID=1964209 RepID=A0A934MCV4_9RHOB|nr:photosynthetic reaction center subunit H [Palleronia pontilimi]MBJ3763203.1 photosynthetic reaction center subunit H [Palleronia pontilimi]
MVGVTFFGNFDLASLAIWLFWGFFAVLIYYLQTENMREGYPLETEDGNTAPNQGPFPVPAPKTVSLPHGGGEVVLPSQENEAFHRREDLALARTAVSEGFPQKPTGDPLLDGVGPASWTPRKDSPELDGHGNPKIQPMSGNDGFFVSAGRDPRGLPVVCKDDKVVGTVTDLWIDEAEQLVRYVEFELEPEFGGAKKLMPMFMIRIKPRWVDITSLNSNRMTQIPDIKTPGQITLLEEEKIMTFFGGGTLYD